MRKDFSVPITLKESDGDKPGEFEAIFSTFDVVDLDGDIVRRSAITDGQRVPVLWAHDSRKMPVATGVISTTEKHAIIKGVFIDSTIGRDAHATIKETADLQELSWGFSILKAQDVTEDGETHRELLETKEHEVSFVLRGAAGPGNTGVESVKSHSLVEQIQHTSVTVRAVLDRAKEVARLRHDKGETLGVKSAEALAELHEDFKELEGLLEGLQKTVKTDGEPTATAAGLRAQLLRFDARERGIS